jgi:hypothetical protein
MVHRLRTGGCIKGQGPKGLKALQSASPGTARPARSTACALAAASWVKALQRASLPAPRCRPPGRPSCRAAARAGAPPGRQSARMRTRLRERSCGCSRPKPSPAGRARWRGPTQGAHPQRSLVGLLVVERAARSLWRAPQRRLHSRQRERERAVGARVRVLPLVLRAQKPAVSIAARVGRDGPNLTM